MQVVCEINACSYEQGLGPWSLKYVEHFTCISLRKIREIYPFSTKVSNQNWQNSAQIQILEISPKKTFKKSREKNFPLEIGNWAKSTASLDSSDDPREVGTQLCLGLWIELFIVTSTQREATQPEGRRFVLLRWEVFLLLNSVAKNGFSASTGIASSKILNTYIPYPITLHP